MNCPICNCLGQHYHVVNGYDSKKCIHCSHIFVLKGDHNNDDGYLYKEEFYDNYMSGMGYDVAFEKFLKNDFLKKLKLLKKYFPRGASVLEVGSGPGYFAQLAEERGYNVTAVETNKGAVHYARKKGITFKNFVCEDLSDQNSILAGRKFDIVISWAVIEHVEDPITFLALLRSFVKPNGLILFDTGVITPLLLFIDSGFTSWLFPPFHLHVFSTYSLQIAARKVNLNIIDYFPNFNLPDERWKKQLILFKTSISVIIHHLKNLFIKNKPGKISQIGLIVCRPC